MSIAVDLADLADTVTKFGFAYLLTVGDDGQARVLAVQPRLSDGRFTVGNLGRSSRRNAAARGSVTLLWPPAGPDDHSLIVDGDAEVTDDTMTISPTHAVLHQPVASRESGNGCGGS